MKINQSIMEKNLAKSVKQENVYLKAIKALPTGALVKKKITGHDYYYLAFRKDGKVKFVYKGKLSKEEIKKYTEAKKMRALYRNKLSQQRKLTASLKKSLVRKKKKNTTAGK